MAAGLPGKFSTSDRGCISRGSTSKGGTFFCSIFPLLIAGFIHLSLFLVIPVCPAPFAGFPLELQIAVYLQVHPSF
jgi:hypothetical protein